MAWRLKFKIIINRNRKIFLLNKIIAKICYKIKRQIIKLDDIIYILFY